MAHELREAAEMANGLNYDEAHAVAETLHKFGQNFDQDVLEEWSKWFHASYQNAWN